MNDISHILGDEDPPESDVDDTRGRRGLRGKQGIQGEQGIPGVRSKLPKVNYSQTIIYGLFVAMVFFVLWLDNHNDHQRDADRLAAAQAAEKDRCVASVDIRDVLRSTVEAIYNLGTGAVQRDPNSPPLTAEQVNQYNAYIERLNSFREDMYAKIKPSETCKPYVDDDNVKPPTPPIPPLPAAKE